MIQLNQNFSPYLELLTKLFFVDLTNFESIIFSIIFLPRLMIILVIRFQTILSHTTINKKKKKLKIKFFET
jgi:hypothetical protein